jgi:hypothetical protein
MDLFANNPKITFYSLTFVGLGSLLAVVFYIVSL